MPLAGTAGSLRCPGPLSASVLGPAVFQGGLAPLGGEQWLDQGLGALLPVLPFLSPCVNRARKWVFRSGVYPVCPQRPLPCLCTWLACPQGAWPSPGTVPSRVPPATWPSAVLPGIRLQGLSVSLTLLGLRSAMLNKVVVQMSISRNLASHHWAPRRVLCSPGGAWSASAAGRRKAPPWAVTVPGRPHVGRSRMCRFRVLCACSRAGTHCVFLRGLVPRRCSPHGSRVRRRVTPGCPLPSWLHGCCGVHDLFVLLPQPVLRTPTEPVKSA